MERPCPVCTNRDYAHFADEHIDHAKLDDFAYASRKQPEFMCLRLVRCLGCDLVYAPEPTSLEKLSESYSHAAFDSSQEANAAARSYAKALKPYIARIPHRHAAVDVGAGSGPLLPLLAAEGFAPVIGIEPSRAAIDAAPEEVKSLLREGMFTPQMLESVRSSLICSFMTLEHVSDPGVLVADAHTLLESGGMVAVVVHDWRAPLNRLLGLKSPIIDVEHLQLFSPESLRRLLESRGYRDVQVKSITNSYALRYWVRLTPLPVRLKNLIIRTLECLRIADVHLPFRVGNMLGTGFKA